MRVVRLAALIATAQVALVVILFTFAYTAYASANYVLLNSYVSGANICVVAGQNLVSGSWANSGGNSGAFQQLNNTYVEGAPWTFAMASQYGIGGSGSETSVLHDNICYQAYPLNSGTYNNYAYYVFSKYADGSPYPVYFYIKYYFNGGSGGTITPSNNPIPPPANGLAFQMLLPSLGTTTPTTSVEFKAQYYVASTTIEATAGHGGFGLSSTKYYLNLTRLDVASTSQWFVGNGAGNDQWNTLDTTIVLTASSTWRGVWTSYDASSTYPTYQQSAYFNFSVQSNTLLSSLGIAGYEQIPSLSSASTTAIAAAPCNITNISGCFQNALVFLFYPSTASLDQFSTLWTTIKNKPPFGYVVAVQNAVSTLSVSSTATFNLGTVPFMSAIFDPFRTAVAVLMWLVFIVAFYHRLSTLDI